MKFRALCVLITVFSLMAALPPVASGSIFGRSPIIISAEKASPLEKLAAREIRRYAWLRGGGLWDIREDLSKRPSVILAVKGAPVLTRAGKYQADLAGRVESLKPQEYLLTNIRIGRHKAVVIAGGDNLGLLYGAYRFIEQLGVRFYLHGDVAPDKRDMGGLPMVQEEKASPLFGLRGIQPFHDFPEGPDWWNLDDYKAIIGQLPKLRMNFFGLHTYPEKRPEAEPTVWIGRPSDIADGSVRFAYPAMHYNTGAKVTWGYEPKATSRYSFGAGMLYDRDSYGSEIMRGLEPIPDKPEDCIEVFNRAGSLLGQAFTTARCLGVKTCVGTETPLVVPKRVAEKYAPGAPDVKELYTGMFQRITLTCPVDYYWLWTPEGWTWQGAVEADIKATLDDVQIAYDALKASGAPFKLATCGWVLGPQNDRALFDRSFPKDVPVSCINRSVGMEPVEPGFADIKGREKWAIPWFEDDPAMSQPQLWVGRMRRDAQDALRYGCTGLMGIHWRTRIIAPNALALSQAGWTQKPWATPAPEPGTTIRNGGQIAAFGGRDFADTSEDAVYQTVLFDINGYHIPVENGDYTVKLMLCEPHYEAAGKRVFGVKIEGETVIESLDMFATAGRDRAIERVFPARVTDSLLDVDFTRIVEMPCVAGLVVTGPNGYCRKINTGGPAVDGYEADIPVPAPEPDTADFYRDWAATEFGVEVGDAATKILVGMDGKLPRPSNWIGGPGGFAPDKRAWADVKKEYAFVESFAALRPQVKGKGNLNRFDYWLANFRYLRATGEMCCAFARFQDVMDETRKAPDEAQRKALAREKALPARCELVKAISEAYVNLLATVDTPGAMGNVTNLEQHTIPVMIEKPGVELEQILGEPLPATAQLNQAYSGPLRVIIPSVRTARRPGEALTLRALILSAEPVEEVTLKWRVLGAKRWKSVEFRHVTRGVFEAALPCAKDKNKDVEYLVKARTTSGVEAVWPPTAPNTGQTVVAAMP